MKNIKLVLFDCDGVLVDSEYLAGAIHAELLTEAGFPISEEELTKRWTGLNFAEILKEAEREGGKPISASLLDKAEKIFKQRMKTDLKPIAGVRECVETLHEKLHLPYCICSNSTTANIQAMLELTGLYDLFAGRIFSAPEVGSKKPKPAPDVYQFAARQAGVAPQHCVALEDSVHGAKAAVDAGMRVVGFTGGSQALPGLSGALMDIGCETVINSQHDFPATIEALDSFKE